MKINILSYAVNNCFPIKIQYKNLKKYLIEDFEFILFNDAYENDMIDIINDIANELKIKCIRVPQKIHIDNKNPSKAYAETLNWSIHEYGVKNNLDIIVQMHTDVFPIKQISILDLLDDNIIASTKEYRVDNGKIFTYLYPALTIINLNSIKDVINDLNFNCCAVNSRYSNNKNINIIDNDNILYCDADIPINSISQIRLDTGGMTCYFINKYIDKGIKLLSNIDLYDYVNLKMKDTEELNKKNITQYAKEDYKICKEYGLNIGWYCENFYHYIAGSQWNIRDNDNYKKGHYERLKLLYKYFG